MQWSTKPCGFGKGCTCLLMFVLMPEVGLGEEAREGKEGRKGSRKEECQRFTNSRKVTQLLSLPSESEVFVHSPHYATCSCLLAWQPNMVVFFTGVCFFFSFRVHTGLMISYLLFRETGLFVSGIS